MEYKSAERARTALVKKGLNKNMKKNIIVGQSGGPTAAINASLAGIIRGAMQSSEIGEIYGALNGIEGLLKRNIIDLRKSIKTAEDYDRLAATPAMALGSCRFKLPAAPHEKYDEILQIFKDYNIGYFFYIGGNDSMDTVKQLSNFFKEKGENISCIGVPKTIDNDLPVTDHTPGFGSAAKYIAGSIAEIALDSGVYDMFSVIVAEIMGRHAGWLAAATVLARDAVGSAPQLIYLPEAPFDEERFIEKVKNYSKEKKLLIIAVSEGIKNKNGEYLSAAGASVDGFGHVALAGVGKYLEELIKEKVGCKVRSIEFSVLQRAAGHFASATDIAEALRIGEEAVRAATGGQTGVMMTFERVSNAPYLVNYGSVPIEKCANLEKTIPAGWIIDGCDVSKEMVEYLRPLTTGRAPYFEKDGMPSYLFLNKEIVSK
ncbi:MAG: 6-phosphofructokinase [Oscillospiraceae bacterium]|jgi:6-phosphofructokinase 1|nr:6-phosphofructokinase [Oscillospiraceae bacterium]